MVNSEGFHSTIKPINKISLILYIYETPYQVACSHTPEASAQGFFHVLWLDKLYPASAMIHTPLGVDSLLGMYHKLGYTLSSLSNLLNEMIRDIYKIWSIS